jgi:hypothetical protein
MKIHKTSKEQTKRKNKQRHRGLSQGVFVKSDYFRGCMRFEAVLRYALRNETPISKILFL